VIPEGKDYKQQDAELEKMNWLASGVIGKVTS
jgi:simple sugar transport system substrate-binding protein